MDPLVLTTTAAARIATTQTTSSVAAGGNLILQPRVIRLKDAAGYLGMDRNRFKDEVRPYFTEIRMGKQGVAFDRLELDAWFDQYKDRNGRPGRQSIGESTWDERKRQASSNEMRSGISTSASEVADFAKALNQATSKKRSTSGAKSGIPALAR